MRRGVLRCFVVGSCVVAYLLIRLACGDGAQTASQGHAKIDSLAGLSARFTERELLHQIRNAEAISELVAALPVDRRPERVLYLAAGSHMAPLAVCEAFPAGQPCSLIFTELDAGVQEGIDAFLQTATSEGYVRDLQSTPPLETSGSRVWSFEAGERRVRLELRVAAGEGASRPPLISPALLDDVDLLISHDWSGDPLGNLRVIYDFLVAARARPNPPPMLMIENLEAHPYPVDLNLFAPLARTSGAYGHRASEQGLGHGRVELGEPLFGGGVILSFSEPWWREVDEVTLTGVFNFLLINEFDNQRRNVLEGGASPLAAPLLLDWWTDFGNRSIHDLEPPLDPTTRVAAVDAAARVAVLVEGEARSRLACRLVLYRALLEAEASGLDVLAWMPAAGFERRLQPGAFPSPEMERLNREAMRHTGRFRAEREARPAEMAEVLDALRSCEVLDACPKLPPEAPEAAARETYFRSCLSWLNGD